MINNVNLSNDELLKRFKEKHKHEHFEVITENELKDALIENEFLSTLKDRLEVLHELIDEKGINEEDYEGMFSSELIKNFINA